MTQPEALRLADLIRSRHGNDINDEAAAELRRLHAECNDLARQLNESNERNGRLKAQRDALLEALRDLVQLEADGRTEYESAIPHWDAARAAIKAVEGEKT